MSLLTKREIKLNNDEEENELLTLGFDRNQENLRLFKSTFELRVELS